MPKGRLDLSRGRNYLALATLEWDGLAPKLVDPDGEWPH